MSTLVESEKLLASNSFRVAARAAAPGALEAVWPQAPATTAMRIARHAPAERCFIPWPIGGPRPAPAKPPGRRGRRRRGVRRRRR